MTDTAERIMKLYKQTNMREGDAFIPEAIINMVRSDNTMGAVDELIELGYINESNDRYFFTKKGFDYTRSELK
ncbi:MAG: hypothetical protein Q8N62_03790 [Candidatus Omnitrophota bacterium]|nr:hypothetical protein [Candidatus Omnitrophota bacterium]